MKYSFWVGFLLLIGFAANAQLEQQRAKIPTADWIQTSDTIGAFSVQTPVKLETSQTTTAARIKLGFGSTYTTVHQGVDLASRILFEVRCSNAPNGIAFWNDTLLFSQIFSNLEQGFGHKARNVEKFVYQGYPAWEAKFQARGDYCWFRLVLRANKIIILQACEATPRDTEPIVKHFFNSLKFSEYTSCALSSQDQLDTAAFSIHWPQKPTISKNRLYSRARPAYWKAVHFASTAPCTGDAFHLSHLYLNPYARVWEKDSLFQLIANSLVDSVGEIIDEEDFLVNGHPAKKWQILPQNPGLVDQLQIVLVGPEAFLLRFSGSKEKISKLHSNSWFNSFQVKAPEKLVRIHDPKLSLLVAASSGTDTLHAHLARLALQQAYEIRQDDYDTLKALLLQPLADDTSYFDATRLHLISQLKQLPFKALDTISIALYKDVWEFPQLQASVLNMLLLVDSAQAFDRFIYLLQLETPNIHPIASYHIFAPNNWNDSTDAKRFESIGHWITNKTLNGGVLLVANEMLYSDSIQNTFIIPWQDSIFKVRDLLLQACKLEPIDTVAKYNYLTIKPLISTLAVLPMQGRSEQFLRMLSEQQSLALLRQDAIAALARNNIKINNKVWQAELETRHDNLRLYKLLEQHESLAALPGKYRTQSNIAIDAIYNYWHKLQRTEIEKIAVYDWYESSWGGQTVLVCALRIELVREDFQPQKTHIAFAGPFPADGQTLTVPRTLVGHSEMPFQETTVARELKDFIESCRERAN